MNASRKRRTRVVVGALMAGSLTLAGCGAQAAGASGASKDARVNLTMSIDYTYGPSVKPIQAMDREYEKLHPNVHISLQLGSSDQKTASQLAAGDAPDIIIWGTASDVGSFAYNHSIIPLNPLIQQDHFNLKQLVPATVKQGESPYNGKIYGLTFLEDTYQVYYNKKLFQQAGITTLPTTLSQMVADAKKLTKFNASGQITQLGLDPSTLWEQDEPNLNADFGGTLLNAKATKSTIDNRAFIKSLTFVNDAYQALGGYKKVTSFITSYAQSGSNVGQDGSLDPFSGGKEGMVIYGDYYTNKLQLLAPNLDYGTFLLPKPQGGPDTAGGTPLGGNPVSISVDDKNPGPAFQYLAWMLTKGEVYLAKHNLLTGNWSATPNYIPLLKDPSVEKNVHFRWFWNVLLTDPHEWNLPMIANVAQYTQLIYQYSQDVVQGSMTPAAAAKTIQQEENRDLSGLAVK